MNWELGLIVTCLCFCYATYAELLRLRKELNARFDRLEAKASDTFDATADLSFQIRDASREVVEAVRDPGK